MLDRCRFAMSFKLSFCITFGIQAAHTLDWRSVNQRPPSLHWFIMTDLHAIVQYFPADDMVPQKHDRPMPQCLARSILELYFITSLLNHFKAVKNLNTKTWANINASDLTDWSNKASKFSGVCEKTGLLSLNLCIVLPSKDFIVVERTYQETR